MVTRSLCLCDGKLIGIEYIYTIINGMQINDKERLEWMREKARSRQLFCPCGCGANLTVVAGDRNLREQHFRILDGNGSDECRYVEEGETSVNSKVILKCWLDEKLQDEDLEARVPVKDISDSDRKFEFTFLSRKQGIAVNYCRHRANLSREKLGILEQNANGINIIHIVDGLFKEREKVNREYLMSLSNNALLQNFYLEAGIILPNAQVISDPENSYLHWGWEAPSCQLRGHFLGHWLSAAAHLVTSNKDRELEAKLYTIVDELKKCQIYNGGEWIGSIPEKYFKRLESNDYIWSPQYTVHKTLLGLLDTFECTGYDVAMDILDHAADWYIKWTDSLKETPYVIVKGEAGGMLEIWARLYGITGEEKYLTLANAYYYKDFDAYLEGKDNLTDNHANASIPMAHGSAKMYEVTGDEKWLTITKEFWKQAVHNREAFATGGQNAGEFWIAPKLFSNALSNRTQEFCTMYNMARLAEYLYRITEEKEYSDYIEHMLYNGFLAQQNKRTGMPTYCLPMRPASRKLWGSKTRDFWCCTGSMVQAQTIYPSLIYFHDPDKKIISVEQYIGSEMNIDGVTISQETNMNYCMGSLFDDSRESNNIKTRWSFTFYITSKDEISVQFRIPGWAKEAYVNGKEINVKDNYFSVAGCFDNEKIDIFFASELECRDLPGNSSATAILDGPIVLAAVDEDGKEFSFKGKSPAEMLTPFVERTYDTYPWQQNSYYSKYDNGKTLFLPLYEITDEPYTIYFSKN